MSATAAVVACLAVMVAMGAWVHLGPPRWQTLTGPAAAVVLLGLGRLAGLSWEQLGLGPQSLRAGLVWGGVAALAVATVYAVGLALPVTRRFFDDARHQIGPREALRRAVLVVPLATVVFEEVAFRSVLWGLVEVEHGAWWAAGVTAVLFGLWHVLPAAHGAHANAVSDRAERRVVVAQVAGTVAFTALAGLVFAALRQGSGSVVAPALLHWATNGLGVLAAALAWRTRDRQHP